MSDFQPFRVLDDGRAIWVYPLTFDRARVSIGPADSSVFDDGW